MSGLQSKQKPEQSSQGWAAFPKWRMQHRTQNETLIPEKKQISSTTLDDANQNWTEHSRTISKFTDTDRLDLISMFAQLWGVKHSFLT